MLALVGGRALDRLGGIYILTNSNETTNTMFNRRADRHWMRRSFVKRETAQIAR